MGRTKRKRIYKSRNRCLSLALDNDLCIISLKQWMVFYNWKDENHLKLTRFEHTGRGLKSTKTIFPKDILIEIPYELMITYTTLQNSYLSDAILLNHSQKLTMQDLLSIYLVFEQHKQNKSNWKTYIDSLPKDIPYLPWLCSAQELMAISQEFQSIFLAKLHTFEESWKRSKASINPLWRCECCSTPGYRLFNINSFTWAFVMVNTRAVYVDPNIVNTFVLTSKNNLHNILLDEPSMALCPFLDMFNHSHNSKTTAKLVQINNQWLYRLITLTQTKRHNEIFISYGSHDNIKLLSEYGFFLCNDELEIISLNFKDVLRICEISLSNKQYRFVHKHHLNQNLCITCNGLSFNLKALLYVALNSGHLDWCTCIYSNNYTEEVLLKMASLIKRVLLTKSVLYSQEVSKLDEISKFGTNYIKNFVVYLKYKTTFIQRIVNSNFEEFVLKNN